MNPGYPLLSQPELSFLESGLAGLHPPFPDFSTPSLVPVLLSTATGPRSYLCIAQPINPSTGTRITLYYSSDGYASHSSDTIPDASSTSLPHQLFRARLLQGSVFNFESRVMSSGSLIQSPAPSYGITKIILADDDPTILLDLTYDWYNAPAAHYIGDPSWPLSQFFNYANTIAAEITRDDSMTYSVGWASTVQILQRDVQPRKYRGMGGAVRFNNPGSSAYVSGTLPCPSGSMTMEIWMRPTTSIATLKRVVCWRNNALAGLRSLDYGGGGIGPNVPRFAVRNDADVLFAATGVVTDLIPVAPNLQHGTHMAGVVDDVSKTIRLLINGVTIATTPYTGTMSTTLLNTLFIGVNDMGAEFMDGDVDELRVWNVARTDAEILANMNMEISSTSPGLYAYYKFNDQVPGNVTAFDSVTVGVTGAPHNLTLTNATWIGSLTGGPSIAGKCIPMVDGRYVRFEPVCVDDVNLVYQINDGSMVSMDVFEHRGLQPYIVDSNVTDITIPTPATGHLSTCIAQGLFKLNAVLSGHLLVSGRGDNQGVVGYAETCADISKKKALAGGLTITQLDVVKFAQISSTYPYPIQLCTRLDPQTADSTIVECMSNVMGWRTVTRDGRLTIGALARPTSIKFTLNENNVALDGVTMIHKSTRVTQVVLGYARYNQTQGVSDLAITNQESITDLGQPYRTIPFGTDTSVLYTHNTSISLSVDAAVEGQREYDYWHAGPLTLRIRLTDGLFLTNIDDGVHLSMQNVSGGDLQGLRVGFEGVIVALGDTVPMDEWVEVCGFMLRDDDVGLMGDDGSMLVIDDGVTGLA